jgi:hypothetical protein
VNSTLDKMKKRQTEHLRGVSVLIGPRLIKALSVHQQATKNSYARDSAGFNGGCQNNSSMLSKSERCVGDVEVDAEFLWQRCMTNRREAVGVAGKKRHSTPRDSLGTKRLA